MTCDGIPSIVVSSVSSVFLLHCRKFPCVCIRARNRQILGPLAPPVNTCVGSLQFKYLHILSSVHPVSSMHICIYLSLSLAFNIKSFFVSSSISDKNLDWISKYKRNVFVCSLITEHFSDAFFPTRNFCHRNRNNWMWSQK